MKLTLQLPAPVAEELRKLPDRDAFAVFAIAKALEERLRTARITGEPMRPRRGRRRSPAERDELGLSLPKNRDRELAWRKAHQGELRSRLAGQWVVLEGEEIVANSRDAAEAVEAARAKGVEVPFLFYVDRPRPGVVQLGL